MALKGTDPELESWVKFRGQTILLFKNPFAAFEQAQEERHSNLQTTKHNWKIVRSPVIHGAYWVTLGQSYCHCLTYLTGF